MPSSTSYLRDDHDVSALKYFSTLCMTIVTTLEDVAAYFVSDRRDDGIELATIIEREDLLRAPSRAMVKKAVARLELPFWRWAPILSRSSIEEGGKWREKRGGAEWKPPPVPKQSKRKSMGGKCNADLRSSSGEEAVQRQQRQLEDQKQQQQLKEQQPDKGQRRDRTYGAACEKWSTQRAKVKAFQRSGVLKRRTASGRLLGMTTGPGEPTKAREGRKVFPECLALIHRRGHSQQRLLSSVEPNRGVESGGLLQGKDSGFRDEDPERRSSQMRSRLLQRLALLAALFMVGPGGVVAQEKDELGFEVRTYNGTNNNLDYPLWGSVNITQIRAVSAASYSDGVSAVSGDDRPSAREVMTKVFLAASSVRSPRSALFVGWALLVSYDLFLNVDDDSLPFDIPCDDGHGTVDVWCPEGSASEDIAFNRSQAEVSAVRNPLNLATSHLDLDYMYGRSEEEAKALRTMEGGYMNLTEDRMPIENDDGTWLIGDQRTAVFPVTFALHIMLLREHNNCCDTLAPDLGYEGDEDIYQACRGWTIAVFQHITNLDFNVRLTGTNIVSSDEYTPFDDVVSSSYATASSSYDSTDSTMSNYTDTTSSTSSPSDRRNRRRLNDLYTGEQNPGADVFATTVGVAAFYAAIPPTVRIMEEGYEPADEDGIELTEAAEDIAGLFKRNSIESIIRGAAFSSTLAVDTHFSSAVSTTSPLFKLPVDAIQRGRDHGVQTYNDAREAYGLSRATSFADVTHDTNVQALLEDAYGGNISRLDALTGALAEGSNMSSSAILGELLQEVWRDQLYRVIAGDRLYHRHDVPTTDAENTTLHDLIKRTTNVTDIPLSVFTVPDITVCYENCSTDGSSFVYLSDEFMLAWDIQDDYEYISYTLSAKYIGGEGYMGIGFGGDEMVDASDFLICEVLSSTSAECTDRQSVSTHSTPSKDTENSSLNVTEVVVDGDWTSVTFYRYRSDLDDEDYDIYEDLDGYTETLIIFSYREGEGVGKHANSNRGASSVNFVTGTSTTVCEEDADFYLLHGALILFAWLAFMPVGIFFARYRKGKEELFGFQWWEAHAQLMTLSAEMVLPLAITAIFSTSGSHNSQHAKWGFYMIAAIAFQILTGILRQRALEGKDSNFSLLHRVNKNAHIWAGHFAFFAGAFQCYRGVELVSETDSLIFSAMEDLVEFEIGNFGIVYNYVMPIWFGVVGALLLFFETRKQLTRYRREGAVMVCCVYELKNNTFVAEGREVGAEEGEGYEAEHRLMPRTQALPLYTMDEFNRKVLNGMSWVIVDGAVLDVENFSRRHPGGARVIVNALGTDISNELKGDDLLIGSAMAFTPHKHSESALVLARSMVVGYIDEEDEGDARSTEQTRRAAGLGLSVTGNHRNSDGTGAKRDHGELGLQRFHVCPFVLRKRLDRGKDDDRAVYRYVFACPGEAAVLAQAATGVCYFNMRVVRKNGDSMVQRSYNATAVKVMGNVSAEASITCSCDVHTDATGVADESTGVPEGRSSSMVSESRSGRRLISGIIDTSLAAIANEGRVRVVPAVESRGGVLCVEMRIRLYKDGTMSKLLEQLPNNSTNATVQLQGPFLVDKLSPPPAHRNVIMIAAGTGINPMVQLIRDYQSFDSQDTLRTSGRSRLALLWQATATSDLYCGEELRSLEARGRGLLEVTTLVSDSHRKRNEPKVPTALQRRRKRRAEAADAATGGSRFAGLFVARSPASIRNQSGDGSAVDGRSFVPTSEAKVPEDGADVATALNNALRDTVVGTRSAEANGTDKTKDGAFKPVHNAGESSLATAVNVFALREERLPTSMEKGEIYQSESDLARGDQWQLDAAPDTPDGAELSTPTPSTLVSAPGMARKPMEISRPSRDLVRGAHNAPRGTVIESSSSSSSSSSSKHAPQLFSSSSCRGTAAFGRRKGKVSKDVLREVFGEGLMQAITGFNEKHPATLGTSYQGLDRSGLEADLAALCGTETESGKLQVVLSGPSGFVFHVENMLEEMGVPKEALIILD